MARLPDPRFAPDCTLRVDGVAVPARAGEPIAVALLAAGRPLLGRSHLYHRPRGPFCLAGSCQGCLVRIGGLPGIRACRTPCRDGLEVETQHAWPNAAHDLLGAIDLAAPRGLDLHRLGTSSRLADRWIVPIARRLGGLGRFPDRIPAPAPPPAGVERFDALVVGAGPAGLGAAERLAAAGRRVLLADGEPRPGGRLRARLALAGEPPLDWATAVASRVAAAGGEVALGAEVLGLWGGDGGPLAAVAIAGAPGAQPGLRLVRAGVVVLCSGGTAVPPAIEDGDRPGIHWGRGLAVALAEHGALPGRRLAVLGSGPEAEALAARLAGAGAEVERIGAAARAVGRARVRALELPGGVRLRCDAVAVVGVPAPATELGRHLGATARLLPGAGSFALAVDAAGRTGIPGLLAAGEVTGPMDGAAAAEAGRRAGEAARG